MGRTRSGSKLRDDDAEAGARVDGVASTPLRTSSPYEKTDTTKNIGGIEDKDVCNGRMVLTSKLLKEKEKKSPLVVYKRRWYILFLFSVIAFMQYCCWNTYGPISNTVKLGFGWTNSEIALLASLDPITYILTSLLFSYIMDVKGLRKSMLISTCFMCIGTGLRCVTSDSSMGLWTMTLGQLLNGLAGPVTQAAPPLLSSVWFPHEQRTTATAIASLSGSLGVALSFVIGPLLVKDINPSVSGAQLLSMRGNHTNQSSVLQGTLVEVPLTRTEGVYADAAHHWPFDELNVTLDDEPVLIRPDQIKNSLSRFEIWSTRSAVTVTDVKSQQQGVAFGFVRMRDGMVNNSIQTDGEHAWLNLGNHVEKCISQPERCDQGLSVALWLRSTNGTTSSQYHVGTSGVRPGYRGFAIFQQDELIYVFVGIGHKAWSSNFTTSHDVWNHVAFTWNKDSGLDVYLNGTWTCGDHVGVATSPVQPYYTLLTVGKPNDKFHSLFSRACYDELTVWHRVLDHQEIKTLSGIPVTDHDSMPVTTTSSSDELQEAESMKKTSKIWNQELLDKGKAEVMRLLYIEFGIVTALFLAVVFYFPAGPPTPPSNSAATKRTDFRAGVKDLARNCQFWTVTLAYGLTTGVYSGWGAVLAVNLHGFDVGQEEAGWIGFYSTLAGIGAGFLLARCADLFGGHMKALLLVLFFGSSSCFLWFSFLCLNIIQFTSDAMYKSAILGGFFVSGTIPLFYEIAVESTYPVAEGVTCAVMTLVNNIFTVIFLIVLMVPGVGTLWMNWLLFGACAVSIPVLMTFKERYRRLEIDTNMNAIEAAQEAHTPSSSEFQCSLSSAEDIVHVTKTSKESVI